MAKYERVFSDATREGVALYERYETDATFHAVVVLIAQSRGSGYRDDNGVWHPGPSVADARLAAEIIKVVRP